jgi:choline dehydrogenase
MIASVPAGTVKLVGHPTLDWRYEVDIDASRDDHKQVWAAGKTLGGSSSINGMVYVRGTRGDFDDWVSDGCPSWGADDVFPYFRKSEHFYGPSSPDHGTEGPLAVSPISHLHPLSGAFVSACEQIGLPRRSDYCGGDLFGAFPIFATIKQGRRCSTYDAFLAPVRGRPNLQIVTEAEVTRIVFESVRAVGVEVIIAGRPPQVIRTRGEVLVCAGTIGSPVLLLRSGVGPAQELRELGVSPVMDLPVGKNLQEHSVVSISKLVSVATYNDAARPAMLAWHLLQYAFLRTGPLSSPAVQAMAYAKSDPMLPEPDVCFSLLPLAMDLTDAPKLHESSGISIAAQICRPYARGSIQLTDPSPRSRPKITYQMLDDERDVASLTFAGRMAERIFSAPPLAQYVRARNQPNAELMDDAQWREYLRRYVGIGYHPVGTCRMGTTAAAVVDPTLRVRGLAGIRVADASIMPRITSGNTNAPSIMIGEKAAALILERR